jgi:CO/xanthine dehydrogenase Mo-binding subunit
VPTDKLSVNDGVISAEASSGTVKYWELIEPDSSTYLVSGKAPLKDPKNYKIIGKSIPRLDLPGKIMGRASYVHDYRPPNVLHARVVRPRADQPNIELVSVNTEEVLRMAGVTKVVRNGRFLAVVAEREEQAIDAAIALHDRVQWRLPILPKQPELKSYLKALPAKSKTLRNDPVDPALESAAHTIEQFYFVPFQSHASIGPSCAVAQDDGGFLTVWTHSQSVFELRKDIADLISRAEDRIRVLHLEGSGCYGQNGADDVAVDAALIAIEIPGKSVRVQWTRQDEFACSPKGPAMLSRIKAGINTEGNIIAWDYEYWTGPDISRYGQGGTSAAIGGWHIEKAARPYFLQGAASNVETRVLADEAVGVYDFLNKRITEHATVQFSPLRSGEIRSVSAFSQSFAIQSMIDELAVLARVDPVEYRLRFVKDQRLRNVIEAVARAANWKPSVGPTGTGRGFSYFFYDRPGARAAAVVEVEVDPEIGNVRVKRVIAGFDLGCVINPDGVRNQMEGGIIQAISRTLKEEVRFDEAGITSLDWDTYPILDFTQVPSVEILLLGHLDQPSGGAGEAQTPLIPGAIANAIFDAVGARVRELPFTPERVKNARGPK